MDEPPISVEELEAAMAAAVDEDGNDIRLAEAVARMTPEQLRESEENIRRWVRSAQAGMRRARERDEPSGGVST